MQNQSNRAKRKLTPNSNNLKSTSQERYTIPKYLSLNYQSSSKVNKYTILEQIGQGSYSTIFIVENKLHGGYYAMKKVLQDPKQINRELQIHQNMHHPHIAPLKDHYFTVENQHKYLHLIMDLYQGNLKNAIKVPIKRVAKQLFEALYYLEEQQIMHRDLKPANILYQSGNIYIADFGSAKRIDGSKSLSYVCSRAYRAPELLFGQTFYNTKIDVWGAGCILAELELGRQLFYGENTVDQLVEICKVLGTPNEVERMELGCQFYLPSVHPKKLSIQSINIVLNQKTDPMLIDLLSKIFVFSPSKRIGCYEALQHPYLI